MRCKYYEKHPKRRRSMQISIYILPSSKTYSNQCNDEITFIQYTNCILAELDVQPAVVTSIFNSFFRILRNSQGSISVSILAYNSMNEAQAYRSLQIQLSQAKPFKKLPLAVVSGALKFSIKTPKDFRLFNRSFTFSAYSSKYRSSARFIIPRQSLVQ